MTILTVNATALYVRLLGPRAAPPLLMIQGLGMQLTDWPRALLRALAAQYRVILLDNRDYGRSQLCGPAIDARLREADYPFEPVTPEHAPYSLDDMAEDARGVLDTLGISRAHVVGFSMGGMIAQVLAARHPQRAQSLVSLMSSAGQAVLPASVPAARTLARMIVHVPDRAVLIEQAVAAQRVWSGPAHPIDPTLAGRHAELGYRRCYRPAAIHRQALAYASTGERFELLRQVRCPTLVIHGALDPIIPVAYAREALHLIRDARWLELPDAAHDLHAAVLPRIAAAILGHLQADERPAHLVHTA